MLSAWRSAVSMSFRLSRPWSSAALTAAISGCGLSLSTVKLSMPALNSAASACGWVA